MKITQNIGVFTSNSESDRFVYHNGPSPWGMDGIMSLTPDKVIAFAVLARDGGKQFWNGTPMGPAKYCVFDVEHPALETMEPNDFAYHLRLFREVAPDVKVGVYGYAYLPEGVYSNRDSTAERFIEILRTRRPVYDLCDFLNDDVYLMGPAWLARDLAYIRKMAVAYADVYPGKPWIPWVHGRYTSVEGRPIINKTTCLQYAKVLRENCDGVLVWHSDVPDIPLHEVLRDRRNTLAKRPLTWASEIWDQSVNRMENTGLSMAELNVRTSRRMV